MGELIRQKEEITEVSSSQGKAIGWSALSFGLGGLSFTAAVLALVSAAAGVVVMSQSLVGLLLFLGVGFFVVGTYSVQVVMDGGSEGRAMKLPVFLEGRIDAGEVIRVQVPLEVNAAFYRRSLRGVDLVLSEMDDASKGREIARVSDAMSQRETGAEGEILGAELLVSGEMMELASGLRRPQWTLRVRFEFSDSSEPFERVIVLDGAKGEANGAEGPIEEEFPAGTDAW